MTDRERREAFDPDRALRLAAHLQSAANLVLSGLKETPGGDAYEYEGSTNTVEWLKEAVQALEDYCFATTERFSL